MTAAGIHLSRTKTIVPSLRPEILHRPRLLALFDDLLDKKLIIVVAPAGYGKTTLMVDFARLSEMPVCWLSLDSLDHDPQRFCAYLIAALQQRFPKFGRQSNGVLRSLTNLEQDSERLLSALVNEIESEIGEHFALMVDDYQFVDSVASIRNIFSRFIYLVGENCHVVLASRRLPTLPDITLMVARQQVGGFDLEQLSFRPDEIRKLFERNYGTNLADESVDELMQRTEGWITGLHLSADRVTRGVPDLTRAARAAGVDLASYLDQQVLALQPPRLGEFLLQTSLLEEFDASLCEAVFGKGNWKSLIKAVQQDNLFVLPVGVGGKWLRYHHLFRDFLQQRFREEEPEKARAILLRLVEVYKERQEWEKAYAICRQLGDPNLLADLIESAGTPMLLSEHLITLRSWLDELPPDLFEERPALLSLKGALLCSLGEGRSALKILDQAVLGFQGAENFLGLALALVHRAAAYRLLGDYEESLRDTDEALHQSKDQLNMQLICAHAERLKGIDLNHLGRVGEAIYCLEDALRYYEQLNDRQGVARVSMDLGVAYQTAGDYSAAQKVYEQALAEWHRGDTIYSEANIFNNLGVLYHYQGEYERAAKVFEAGLKLTRQNISLWHESLLLTSLGDMYIDLEEYESACQAYARASEIMQQVNYQFLASYLDLAWARLARLRGRFKEAYQSLKKVETLILSTKSSYECGLFRLEAGCLQFAEARPDLAINELKAALDYFLQGDLITEVVICRIWLAGAYLMTGEVASGRSQLQIVFREKRFKSLFYPLLPIVRQVRPLLEAIQDDSEVGPSLVPWLENVAQAELKFPVLRKRLRRLLVTVPIQASRLTIQAFGRAQVQINGKLVTASQWKTASVRELFFYLLTASHPLTKEEIGEIIWPEMDASRMKLRFKNDLYRLRRALGKDIILFDDNRYHFNRLLDHEYDVENFINLLNKAKISLDEEKIACLRAATNLRRGPYLHDIDATWVWPERERLDQTCLDALKQQVEFQHQKGDLQAALQACQDALMIDPCSEHFHRLAMQLHAELGNRLDVIWQYQACCTALRTQLDVGPSAETETLYQQLTN